MLHQERKTVGLLQQSARAEHETATPLCRLCNPVAGSSVDTALPHSIGEYVEVLHLVLLL